MKKQQNNNTPKKTYRAPALKRFGSLRELTTGGTNTANEGSAVPLAQKRP